MSFDTARTAKLCLGQKRIVSSSADLGLNCAGGREMDRDGSIVTLADW